MIGLLEGLLERLLCRTDRHAWQHGDGWRSCDWCGIYEETT